MIFFNLNIIIILGLNFISKDLINKISDFPNIKNLNKLGLRVIKLSKIFLILNNSNININK